MGKETYSAAVFTVSTSRFERYGSVEMPEGAGDVSGKLIWGALQAGGHRVVRYELIPDRREVISDRVKEAVYSGVDVIVISGGTGLTSDDVTIEAVAPLLEKEMPGFGELFRLRSLEQVGDAVILTRATGGVARGKAIFCLPGSPDAVKLGMEIIMAQLSHIMQHLRD